MHLISPFSYRKFMLRNNRENKAIKLWLRNSWEKTYFKTFRGKRIQKPEQFYVISFEINISRFKLTPTNLFKPLIYREIILSTGNDAGWFSDLSYHDLKFSEKASWFLFTVLKLKILARDKALWPRTGILTSRRSFHDWISF